MKYLKSCRSSIDYIDKFPEDTTAIIVCAGPSLSKNIEVLKQAKGKAVIIAVDTALPSLKKADIKPDIIVSLDCNKSLKHFMDFDFKDTYLFADMVVNTAVLDYIKPDNLVFYSSDSVVWDKLFKAVGSEIRTIYTGGSVGIDAASIMIHLGVKRLAFIGLDLALTGNVMHAGDGEVNMESLPYDIVKVEDVDGGEVYTRKDYFTYIKFIENMAYQFSNVEFIDATEGGAKKNNMKIMTLQEVIDSYCKEDIDIHGILESAPRLFIGDDQKLPREALDDMQRHLKHLRDEMRHGVTDCEQGIKILKSSNIDVKRLKKINANIDKLDELLNNSDEVNLISKNTTEDVLDFIDDIYVEVDNDIDEAVRMYEKCVHYYGAVADSADRILEVIKDCRDNWKQDKD